MYEAFYGFTGRPFQLNPDPSFYYASSQHRRAKSYIDYGLHQSEGFIVVTGEVGAGKTTVVRSMLARLDPTKVVAANLVSTQLDAEDTLRMVAAAFGIPTRDRTKADLLLSLEAQLASNATQGRRSLLIVDEAQNLAPRAVEELRMLSNFQLGTHALLQTFLVGQPEFRHILQSPEMNQLRQRVIAACHIGPLTAEETRKYVEHRLKHVGWQDSPRFEPGAFAAIHQASGGVPRRINLLCDRLLLSGFVSEKKEFSVQSVHDVAGGIVGETSGQPAPQARGGLSAATPPLSMATLSELTGGSKPAATPEALNSQLEFLEKGVRDLEDTLSRMDRGSESTTQLMRKIVELLRRNVGGTPH